ncbi:hypothetical protein HUT16_33930 [Kitasatospora sp. NA04385]|uniref:hypothetical protein n=1 Tax=Kitasatospora sp. NA04385 TaxID=2742135 RepID=UPI00159012E3|nr:hypothetical protein [Kitasatospora sp. NA04385]QKW23423.1 hypothetical protein HUT16_33930 [Kitasatospora sp. NA04385]
MTIVLGNRDGFAIEIGDRDGYDPNGHLRRVDLWAAGQWLTCDDNAAFVAQFRFALAREADWLRTGGGPPPPWPDLSPEANHRRLPGGTATPDGEAAGSPDHHRALDWGPTTDNLIAALFRDGDHLTLTFQFWREDHLLRHPEHAGRVFTVELPTAEFVGLLDRARAALDDTAQQHQQQRR